MKFRFIREPRAGYEGHQFSTEYQDANGNWRHFPNSVAFDRDRAHARFVRIALDDAPPEGKVILEERRA